jgi:hypothetical protein
MNEHNMQKFENQLINVHFLPAMPLANRVNNYNGRLQNSIISHAVWLLKGLG